MVFLWKKENKKEDILFTNVNKDISYILKKAKLL